MRPARVSIAPPRIREARSVERAEMILVEDHHLCVPGEVSVTVTAILRHDQEIAALQCHSLGSDDRSVAVEPCATKAALPVQYDGLIAQEIETVNHRVHLCDAPRWASFVRCHE